MHFPGTRPALPALRFLAAAGLLFSAGADVGQAQQVRDHVVDLSAAVSTNAPPHIVLNWGLRLPASVTAQTLYRRAKGGTTWSSAFSLGTAQTQFVDTNGVLPGVAYEYRLYRGISGSAAANGFLLAGAGLPMVEDRGTLLLVFENTLTNSLAPELSQLVQDLVGDGWTVQEIPVARAGTPPVVKSAIKAAYQADPSRVKAVYLLGRVPVPYSGSIAPDGHGDHAGAWPADGYYGDMTGAWTDTSVNNSSASDARNRNTPGDGKFDQSVFPVDPVLQVGRVDMANMTKFPGSAATETTLLRRYLRKAHDFKHRAGLYASVPRRAMLRDGFGYFSGEMFASTGWRTAFAWLGGDAAIDLPGSWFPVATNVYLFGYGCGAGGPEGASTCGNSTDFGAQPSRAVFTALFGSYLGDWDYNNDFLRAPLAGNATGDSYGLCCFWAGRPHWYMHAMGLGETLGYATWDSMREDRIGSFGNSGVHMGLMGDPSLRAHPVIPPRNLRATSTAGQVQLAWNAAAETDLLGYHVYRAAWPAGSYARLTASPLAAASYLDATATPGQVYTYMVRTLKLERSPSGTYQNLSQGAFATLAASAAPSGIPFGPADLVARATHSAQVRLDWLDQSDNETGFRVERKDAPSAAFVPRVTLAAGVTNYADAGPLPAGGVFYYRVVATGAAGDSLPSNEAAVDGAAGFMETVGTPVGVDKPAGTGALGLRRIGGSIGPASVAYATTGASAVAGTHFTTTSGTMSWADGAAGVKTVNVPLLNYATPQLPRQLRLTLSSPSGGGLTQATSMDVIIDDSTATLAAPWQEANIGGISLCWRAVSAEGAMASLLRGGSLNGTYDTVHFVYQTRTGDGVFVTRVNGTPLQSGAYAGVMIRDTTANSSPMVAAWVPAGGTPGSKLAARAVSWGSTPTLSASDGALAPYWLRLTRAGNSFTAESSPDGAAWTTIGSTNVTLAATACWGLFHYSNYYASDWQLATFSGTAIGAVPPPAAPTNLVAVLDAGGSVRLAWEDRSTTETGFRLERRAEGGAFALLASPAAGQTNHVDTTAVFDTGYTYRVCALGASSSTSTWSNVAVLVLPPGLASPLPTRPTELAAVCPAAGRVALAWRDNASNETGYRVEVSTNGGVAYMAATNLPANTQGAAVAPAPVVLGAQWYRVVAFNSSGASTPSVAAFVQPYTASIQLWRANYGLAADGTGDGSPLADPDHDDMPNLWEYAFHLNPTGATVRTPAFAFSEYRAPNGTRLLRYVYPRYTDRTDVTFTLETRASLRAGSWTPIARSTGGGKTVRVGSLSLVTETGSNPVTVTVIDGTSDQRTNQFVRLRLNSP